MIDSYFIETAQNIRNRYFEHQDKLNEYAEIVKDLHDELMKCSERLFEIVNNNKNTRNKQDLILIGKDFEKEMDLLENKLKSNEKERAKYEEVLKELNDESDKLWHKIKTKYPTLSNEEIGNYILENMK
jgi:chromosome segregation ATPase